MGFLWIGIAIVALIIKSFTKEYITLCIAAAALITAFMAFNKFDGKIVHQVVTFFASTIVLALFILTLHTDISAYRKSTKRILGFALFLFKNGRSHTD